MSKRIMIVAAHPDDEALGCAGLIGKIKKDGNEFALVFMTDGISSRVTDDVAILKRQQGGDKALDFVNPDYMHVFDYPDNQMDTVPLLQIVKGISKCIAEFKPEIVITHWSGDLNIDHRITYQAVVTAIRPEPSQYVQQLWCFEVNSSSDYIAGNQVFSPNVFVDISDYWSFKEEYLACYSEEIRPFPHSRSVEAIKAKAMTRGSQVGVSMAEAFLCERRIIKDGECLN
ncbi:MAG: PIG-L family deacetylase [Oleispira sp.]